MDNSFGIDVGLSKTGFCSDEMLLQMEIKIGNFRTAKSVKCKTQILVLKLKEAADRNRSIGKGICATDGKESYKEFMLGISKPHQDLLPILGSRLSISIFITTNNLDENHKPYSSCDDGNGNGNGDDDDNYKMMKTTMVIKMRLTTTMMTMTKLGTMLRMIVVSCTT